MERIAELIDKANGAVYSGNHIRAAVALNDVALAMRDAGDSRWKYYYDLAREYGKGPR